MTRYVFSALAILALAGPAHAQKGTNETGYTLRTAFPDPADAPIKMSLAFMQRKTSDGRYSQMAPSPDGEYPQRPDNVMLRLENVSGRKIMAYALVSEAEGFLNVQINPQAKPMPP